MNRLRAIPLSEFAQHWRSVDQGQLEDEAKLEQMARMLEVLIDNEQFQLAFSLVDDETGAGARRQFLLERLFESQAIPLEESLRMIGTLKGMRDQMDAKVGLTRSLWNKGLTTDDKTRGVIASLDTEMATLVGRSTGGYAPPGGTQSERDKALREGLDFLSSMRKDARTDDERRATEAAYLGYLAGAAGRQAPCIFGEFEKYDVSKLPQSGEVAQSMLIVVRELVRTDPPRLLGNLETMGESCPPLILGVAVQSWAQQDLNRLNGWLEPRMSKFSEPQRDAVASQLSIEAFLQGDTERAAEWASMIKDKKLSENTIRMIRR